MESIEAIIVIAFIVFAIQIFRIRQLKVKSVTLEPLVKSIENAKDIHYQYCLKDGGYYVYLSPKIDNILGEGFYEEHVKNPRLIYSIIHPDDLSNFIKKEQGIANFDRPLKYRIRHKNGQYIWLEETVTPVFENGKVVLLYGIYRDINEEMQLKKKLHYKLTHDSLTNVYNRTFFDDLFETYNEKKDEHIGIMICDLDNLKVINDQFGHSEGDYVIKETARILKGFEDENTYLARLGGDEFVFFKMGNSGKSFESIKEQINESLEQYEGHISIQISTGYAETPNSLGNLVDILNLADKNMYINKGLKNTR